MAGSEGNRKDGYYEGDPPWMAHGTREDGYPVLDPRDYRDVPGDAQVVSKDVYTELMRRELDKMQTQRDFELLRFEYDQSDEQVKLNMLNRLKNSARAQDRDFARALKAFEEGVDE